MVSSPRYNVGTAMPILVDFVFQFLRLRTYKSSITLLYFQYVWIWHNQNPLQSYNFPSEQKKENEKKVKKLKNLFCESTYKISVCV